MFRGARRVSSGSWRSVVAVVAVLAIGMGACSDQSISDDESALADQVVVELSAAGLDISPELAAALWGTDGGRICAGDGPEDFNDVVLVSHRFALRKTAVSTRDVAVAAAVIDVYCPDRRPHFNEFVEALETGETSDDG